MQTMQTKELADELIIWLPKLSAGIRIEVIYKDGMIAEILGVIALTENIAAGNEIRIKQTPVPDAPDGESWHNPDNLTLEQVGVDDGWRLLLVSEAHEDRERLDCDIWCAGNYWVPGLNASNKTVTYRVKTAEHPVGSLKPKEEGVKCREWWLSKTKYKDSWARRYQYAFLKNGKTDGLGEVTRVIEVPPNDVVEKAMVDAEGYSSKTGCIFVPNALYTLKELGMIADD